jgi:nitroreductase
MHNEVMDALECLKTRRSVRRFKDEKVKSEDLRTILECALLAPSGSNKQPWEFFVVQDKEKLERLSEVCTYGKFIKNGSCCIIVTGDDSKSTHVVEDCSAATENILLAAHDLGYGGCWIAGWNRGYETDVMSVAGIKNKNKNRNKDLKLVSLIALGVPEEDLTKMKKRSLEDAVHFV